MDNLLRYSTILFFLVSLLVLSTCPRTVALDSQVYNKLHESRDALLAQQREIKRANDDLSRQIDELKRKQALLDTYDKQTDAAIRELDRILAMN